MTIEHKTTHTAEVPDLLIEVLRDKPNFLAFINTYVGRVQELEDAVWDVFVGRLLDNAVGAQLDGLGEVVGAPRAGRDDETYRVRLRVQIRLNFGSGRGEDIIAAFQLVLQSSTQFLKLREGYPAEVTLDLRAEFGQAVIDELVEILGEAKGAAIRAQLRYYLQPLSETFRFSTSLSAVPTFGSTRGFTGLDPGGTVWTPYASNTTGVIGSSFLDDLYVVWGEGNIATSSDALTWTAQAAVPLDVRAITFGAGMWVHGDAAGDVYSSPDLITWTLRTSGFGIAGLKRLLFADGVFVAVGSSGLCKTSLDGVTWSTQNAQFGSTQIECVVHDGAQFIAVGRSGKISTSADGATWVARTSGTGSNLFEAFVLNGHILAIGASGVAVISADGLSWSSGSTGLGFQLRSATYGAGLYMIVGDSATCATSPDGITWTVQTTGDAQALLQAAFNFDLFIVAGTAGEVRTSPNGTAWTLRYTAPSSVKAMTSQGAFVVVSGGADLAVSENETAFGGKLAGAAEGATT